MAGTNVSSPLTVGKPGAADVGGALLYKVIPFGVGLAEAERTAKIPSNAILHSVSVTTTTAVTGGTTPSVGIGVANGANDVATLAAPPAANATAFATIAKSTNLSTLITNLVGGPSTGAGYVAVVFVIPF